MKKADVPPTSRYIDDDVLADLISDATCDDPTPWAPHQETLILLALRELAYRKAHQNDWANAAARYEKLRKLNPRQYSELWERNLTSEKRFDEWVDELPT